MPIALFSLCRGFHISFWPKYFFLEHVPAHLEIFEIVPLFLASNRMYFTIPISGDYPAVNVGFQAPVLTIALGFGKKNHLKV